MFFDLKFVADHESLGLQRVCEGPSLSRRSPARFPKWGAKFQPHLVLHFVVFSLRKGIRRPCKAVTLWAGSVEVNASGSVLTPIWPQEFCKLSEPGF